MSKPNAVKFKAIIKKASLKQVVMDCFDLAVVLKYPNLADAKEEIPIRGTCLLVSFESLVRIITPKDLSFVETLKFQQNVSFKLIEIRVSPCDLPAGAEKEENINSIKK